MREIDNAIKGIAGTYHVAAELSRQGYVASMTCENTKAVDLLVADVDANKAILMQVKTNFSSSKSWRLKDKHESWIGDNLFYAFVNLDKSDPPSIYIVPSAIVSDYIKKLHRLWLETPGRGGRKHRDNPNRHFRFDEVEKLHLLGDVPWTLGFSVLFLVFIPWKLLKQEQKKGP